MHLIICFCGITAGISQNDFSRLAYVNLMLAKKVGNTHWLNRRGVLDEIL